MRFLRKSEFIYAKPHRSTNSARQAFRRVFVVDFVECLALLFACLFAAIPDSPAQTFERVVSGVPFEYQGEPLTLPFFGGLDGFLPQFLDIDADGDLDLFVLKPFISARDRQLEGRLSFFENLGAAQAYRFEFRTNFYENLDVRNWFYFLDVDADGDFDLYHDNGAGGLALQRNIGTRTHAQFVLAVPTVLDRDNQKVANEFSSTPVFADIDGDGDFDFFTGLSIGTIVFYRNVGSAAAPLFSFETNRWQDLLIVSGGVAGGVSRASHAAESGGPNRSLQSLALMPPPRVFPQMNGSHALSSATTNVSRLPAFGNSATHGSNVLAFHDLDGDGDQDFFYGDFFHKSVYHLRNNGDAREAKIAIADTLWPPPQPVMTRGYNGPRFADLDADGYADFFVAALNHNRRHFLYYRNEGDTGVPQFRFQTDNFLSLLDIGGNCAPALADLDADQDLDLVLGALDGDLIFFENSGSAAAPIFREAPQKFPHLRITGYVSAPCLVDIDADGDYDLFAGDFFGAIGFFENQGTPQTPSFVLNAAAFEGIDVGFASSPHFADLDHDGDFDLAVGEIDKGAVTFYENVGTAAQPSFMLKSTFEPVSGTTDSKPFLHDWNGDGIVDLFIGQRNGRILYYQGTSHQFSDEFVLAEDEFGGLRVGASSALAFGDLNHDGAEDLLLGEEAGGLSLYVNHKHTAVTQSLSLPSTFTLSAHPNPLHEVLSIDIHPATAQDLFPPSATIYDLLGAYVAELAVQANNDGTWKTQWRAGQAHLRSGIYFLHVRSGRQHRTQKILFVQ